jgi:uncharacterized protein (DUF736 family)
MEIDMKLGDFMVDNEGTLHGQIHGLGLTSTQVISDCVVSHSGRHYLKLIADPMGDAFEIGVAFLKEKDGMFYYSVSLDSPVFPAPIHAALFHDKEDNIKLNLVWNRMEEKYYSPDVGPEGRQRRHYVGAEAPKATP